MRSYYSSSIKVIKKMFFIFLILANLSSYNAIMNAQEVNLQTFAKIQTELAQESNDWFEGYQRTISGQQINYHSGIPQVNQALITRATDGKMAIEWETQAIPDDFNKKSAIFTWAAGIGANSGVKNFNLFMNDEWILSFQSPQLNEWKSPGKYKIELQFRAIMEDVHHDLFGFCFLNVPREFLKKNNPLKIKVVGESAGSQAWFMTFRFNELASLFQKSADKSFWYRLTWHSGSENLKIEGPRNWAGNKIQVVDPTGSQGFTPLTSNNDLSCGRINLNPQSFNRLTFPLSIKIGNKIIDQLDSLDGKWIENLIADQNLLIIHNKRIENDLYILEASGTYFPSISRNFVNDSLSYFRNGTIHLLTSSHQDIAWMDSPERCVQQRDVNIITPALEMLKTHPDYHYSCEQALMLKEYLDRHPEKKDEILQYTREKRLEWGATFNQPYEGLYPGEALIRQLYFGRKWLKKTLPGCDSRLAWNLDVPGRTLQMPQILKKSGVNYFLISRHEKGLFYWQSPDGSRVGVHSPGHYHHASDFLRKSTLESFYEIPEVLKEWNNFYKTYQLTPLLPIIYSSDMSTPKDFSELMALQNHLKIRSAEKQEIKSYALPPIQYNIAETVMEKIFETNPPLPVIQGERPNVWLYIHGPTHYQAISALRSGVKFLTAAEKFSSIAAILNQKINSYPLRAFSKAWESCIYPDHGWGGKNGHITDSTFQAKYEFARDTGTRLLTRAINDIAAKVKIRLKSGKPLIVFNDLSWQRTNCMTAQLSFQEGEAFNIQLIDFQNQKVPVEISDPEKYPDGSFRTLKLTFIAQNIPSIGYKTYYIQYLKKAVKKTAALKDDCHEFENQYYKISFKPGGIGQIYDKQLAKDLFLTDKFLAGELFTLNSEGNGAGEFAEIQQPTMENFDKLSLHQPEWKQIADGPVSSTFLLEQELPNYTIRQKVTLFYTIKQINFEVDLLNWDGTPYREFRLAFPLNMQQGKVTYEVPFGKVTVGEDEIPGAAGERYVQPAADVRPREIMDWINISDDNFGLTMSSSVAVCDYVDPTNDPVSYPVLQPILLASRRSCHGEGNWYLQKGDHHFKFSITSHEPGWQNGYHFGVQSNTPLHTVIPAQTIAKGVLPAEKSFCTLSRTNVILTTIKKCEDDDNFIIRYFEMEGKNTAVTFDWLTNISRIEKVNLIEEEGAILSTKQTNRFNLKIGHHGIETIKIRGN